MTFESPGVVVDRDADLLLVRRSERLEERVRLERLDRRVGAVLLARQLGRPVLFRSDSRLSFTLRVIRRLSTCIFNGQLITLTSANFRRRNLAPMTYSWWPWRVCDRIPLRLKNRCIDSDEVDHSSSSVCLGESPNSRTNHQALKTGVTELSDLHDGWMKRTRPTFVWP